MILSNNDMKGKLRDTILSCIDYHNGMHCFYSMIPAICNRVENAFLLDYYKW